MIKNYKMFLLFPSLAFCLVNLIPRPDFIAEILGSTWTLTEDMQIGYRELCCSPQRSFASVGHR